MTSWNSPGPRGSGTGQTATVAGWQAEGSLHVNSRKRSCVLTMRRKPSGAGRSTAGSPVCPETSAHEASTRTASATAGVAYILGPYALPCAALSLRSSAEGVAGGPNPQGTIAPYRLILHRSTWLRYGEEEDP